MRGYSLLGPLVLGCSCAALLGCGGGARAAPPAEPAPLETLAPAALPSASAAALPSASAAGAPSDDAQTAAPAIKPNTEKSEKRDDPDAAREIDYVIIPDGLKISVAGVRFTVSSRAAPIGPGWGVKVSVAASAEDGEPHSLSSPKDGPLAFAGTVTRTGDSEAEPFGDQRGGDGEQSIFGDDATKFSRVWPNKGLRALAIGDSLDLQVGLWGLGANMESRRPVKQFCHVRLAVDPKGKPRASLEPPASASAK